MDGLNVVGSIFSICSALFAFCQAYKSKILANQVKDYHKRIFDSENLDKLSLVLGELRDIQDKLLNFKYPQKGFNKKKALNELESKVNNILHIIPSCYRDITEEIKQAIVDLQSGLISDEEIRDFENTILRIILIAKESKEKIKFEIKE